jgi:3-oxoacyl-[acyl-carrier protein] reductase
MTRRVLIAGGSGDIGRALIERLPAERFAVAAHYCRSDPGALAAGVASLQADLSRAGEARRLVDAAAELLGGLDVLVQLSGDVRPGIHWTELSLEHWRYEIDVNLTSVLFLVQAAAPHLRRSAAGRVVLTSSAYATRGGGPTSAPYAVAKAGVESLTRLLARDLAPTGVLVNCVSPGFVLDRFSTVRCGRSPAEVDRRVGSIPVGYPGRPADVAREIEHLASAENRFVTGQVVTVDGGDFI